MKKKKGFTLIELLAVIVVLAIIALIATPIVMNTIKNSKKGAAERTANNYTDQVETSLMTYRLENGANLPDGEYTIDSNGNLTGNGLSEPLTVEMNGTKPSSGTIVIENGGVKKESSSMTVGDYDVTYDTTNKTFVAKILEVLCKAKEEVTNGNKAEGNYNYGDEYSCELGDGEEKTFYVLENNDNTVSLILDTDLGDTVAWISKEDYINSGGIIDENDNAYCQYQNLCANEDLGPVTALNYLKDQTTSWIKLDESQITLPTYNQIYDRAEFEGRPILPMWLRGSYWLLTLDIPKHAKCVQGDLPSSDNIENNYNYKIRPVITISKAQLG